MPAWDTAAILAVWAAAYALPLLLATPLGAPRLAEWGASVAPWPGPGEAWRLLASTCLHASPWHFLSNALALGILGPSCARLLGRPGFWIAFVAGGLAASAASVAWRSAVTDSPTSSVGGSGAVFAVGAAMLSAAWRKRHDLPPGRARALVAALVVLLGQALVAGLTRQATDNAAHLGGAGTGLLLGLALPLRSAEHPAAPRPLAFVAVAAAAALAGAVAMGLTSGVHATR